MVFCPQTGYRSACLQRSNQFQPSRYQVVHKQG